MTAEPFITLDEVKSFTDPNYSGDTLADPVIMAVISAVCEAMEMRLGRPVIARTITKTFDGGSSRVRLPHVAPGVLTVSTVVEDGNILTADVDYLVYSDEGYVVRLAGTKTAGKWAEGLKRVSVTFTAGVAADVDGVPENLKLAAKIGVRHFLRLGPEDYGSKLETGAWIKPDMFPRQALWLMDPYRVVMS